MTKKHDTRYPVEIQGLSVNVKDDFNRALRAFNKKVSDSGLIKHIRDTRYFEKGAERKTKQKKAARKRWLKKVEQMQPKQS